MERMKSRASALALRPRAHRSAAVAAMRERPQVRRNRRSRDPCRRRTGPRLDRRGRITDGPYKRQVVFFRSNEAPGTFVITTSEHFLYVVLGDNRALRYGIGVGREGFQWSGLVKIAKMAEWPDWTPPPEMIQRQPYLPRFMAGGPGNPMGARALYLGATVYRIHGTNQPETIGQRSRPAASGSPTATSSISSSTRRSAPRSSSVKRRSFDGSRSRERTMPRPEAGSSGWSLRSP